MARPKSTTSIRSKTITVRMDPITLLAVELAAMHDRRTVSSFIDVACREAAQRRQVALDQDDNPISVLALAEQTWAPDPELQTVHLAISAASHLIPSEHQVLGKAIIYFCNELNALEAQSRRRPPVDLEAIEAQAGKRWASDPKLRAECDERFESYLAFEKANAQGQVRFLTEAPEPHRAALARAAQAALPDIKAAIAGDTIDYKRIADIAQAACVARRW